MNRKENFKQVDGEIYHFITDHIVDSMEHFLICKNQEEAMQFALEQKFCSFDKIKELFEKGGVSNNGTNAFCSVKKLTWTQGLYRSIWKKKMFR